ncbi:MAG: hypothetical protein KIT69_13335 [Propionibacteriaceae bacterium]|nr:hypothetical protein [Propionibacteriaceae bacterium]
MVGTLRGIGDEFVGLLRHAGTTWWRLAPWLLGLCLLGWVGNYAAVLLGTELAFHWPWLVIFSLAIGTVAQLAAIVLALRVVLRHAGSDVAPVQEVPGSPPSTGVRLVARTLLPFLAIYAAFGFVDDYARNVVLALTGRYGFGSFEFLMELNPIGSTTTLALVIGMVVALYLLRRGLDWLAGRSDRAWIGLVGAVVEASGVLLVLLSAFRIVEWVKLWLNSRQLAAWWDATVEALFGWIHLTGIWLDAWEFLAANAWPAFWEVLTQPLAWLALTAVVAGIKVATSAELLKQSSRQGAAGLSRVANGFFTGDLDDKFLPLWHAVRFLAAAGLPLLGGYILAFTAIDWIGDLVQSGVDQLIGPQYDKAALRVMPFYDLIPLVLVMGLRLALLGVTVARVGDRVAAGDTTGRPRVGEAVVVFAVCVALALSSLAYRPSNESWVVTGEVNAQLPILDALASVADARAGHELVDSWGNTRPTDLVFLVVPVTLARERGSVNLRVSLRAGDRHYKPWDGAGSVITQPGFATRNDVVFELDPADLASEPVVELRPGGSLQLGELVGEVRLPALTPAAQVSYSGTPTEWIP